MTPQEALERYRNSGGFALSDPHDEGVIDALLALSEYADELDAEKTRLERELKVAVAHHDNYRDKIDIALGEPRDLVNGPILEEHLEAIRRLKEQTGCAAREAKEAEIQRVWEHYKACMEQHGFKESDL